ncbi:MAG: hypothetical protein MHM6MM_004593 [Cercozoa sp. M6MM]
MSDFTARVEGTLQVEPLRLQHSKQNCNFIANSKDEILLAHPTCWRSEPAPVPVTTFRTTSEVFNAPKILVRAPRTANLDQGVWSTQEKYSAQGTQSSKRWRSWKRSTLLRRAREARPSSRRQRRVETHKAGIQSEKAKKQEKGSIVANSIAALPNACAVSSLKQTKLHGEIDAMRQRSKATVAKSLRALSVLRVRWMRERKRPQSARGRRRSFLEHKRACRARLLRACFEVMLCRFRVLSRLQQVAQQCFVDRVDPSLSIRRIVFRSWKNAALCLAVESRRIQQFSKHQRRTKCVAAVSIWRLKTRAKQQRAQCARKVELARIRRHSVPRWRFHVRRKAVLCEQALRAKRCFTLRTWSIFVRVAVRAHLQWTASLSSSRPEIRDIVRRSVAFGTAYHLKQTQTGGRNETSTNYVVCRILRTTWAHWQRARQVRELKLHCHALQKLRLALVQFINRSVMRHVLHTLLEHETHLHTRSALSEQLFYRRKVRKAAHALRLYSKQRREAKQKALVLLQKRRCATASRREVLRHALSWWLRGMSSLFHYLHAEAHDCTVAMLLNSGGLRPR